MNKKFSLLEILAALAVISILASLLLPALSKARKTSKNVICKNNLHQNYVGLFMYTDDNEKRFMKPYDEANGPGYPPHFYDREIAYYLGDRGESQSCPVVIDKYDKEAVSLNYKGQLMAAYRSYSVNELRSTNPKSEKDGSGNSTKRSRMGLLKLSGKSIKITQVNPATIVAFEGNYASNEYVRFWGYKNYGSARAVNVGNHGKANYSNISGSVLSASSSEWQADDSIRVSNPSIKDVLGGISVSFDYNNPVEFNNWSWDQ